MKPKLMQPYPLTLHRIRTQTNATIPAVIAPNSNPNQSLHTREKLTRSNSNQTRLEYIDLGYYDLQYFIFSSEVKLVITSQKTQTTLIHHFAIIVKHTFV